MGATVSEYKPHRHIIRGRRGDGVPATEVVFRFGFDGATIDKSEWTALAQLRASRGADVVEHTYSITLRDTSDDAEILSSELEVRLAQIPGSVSTTIAHDKLYGDIQLTKTGAEPITVVDLEVTLTEDVSR
ncbi:MAG: hypothetical protein AAF264_12485 [Pseudomonadota bacterium]